MVRGFCVTADWDHGVLEEEENNNKNEFGMCHMKKGDARISELKSHISTRSRY